MVQLNEVATQVKSRIGNVITKIKSHEQDRSSSLSSSSASPNAAKPDTINHQTAKVVDAVFNTLFGACTGGSSCTSRDDSQIVSETFQKKNILSKEQREQLQTLKQAGSNIESRYAQFYQDDHGRAARAVLMASEREEKEKINRRKHWQAINRQAKAEAVIMTVEERRKNRRDFGSKELPQHREHIQVNGNPVSLEEVNQEAEEESDSGYSYNYDDGISALSAHTLEEMAKAEAILQRQSRIPKEPQEQGFDLSIENIVEGPPSPTGTEGSNSTQEGNNEDHSGDHIQRSTNSHHREEAASPHREQKYPVQMARNQSNTGSSITYYTSKSDFTSRWKTQEEQQYWTQVVDEEDNPSRVS